MARRRKAEKRTVTPDERYQSELIARMINALMQRGKKSTAQRIVYDAVDALVQKVEGDPVEVVSRAIDQVKPQVEVKSRRVGGATYQVPVEVAPERQFALAMRWLKTYAQGRKGVPMAKALAYELIDAYNNTGSAVKKRDDTHKMAQANRAFAHYRW
jgi:small subunit ribosomal protein S7